MKIVKTLLKSNQDLDERLFALEKSINKEKILRSTSSSSGSTSSSSGSSISSSNSATMVPSCSQITTCSTCVAKASCGWCQSSKKCIQGDAVGPLTGSCSFYDYGKCSESGCNGYRDCSACLVNTDCGWCEAMGMCLEGTKNGPKETCGNGYLHKDLFSQCKANTNPLANLEKELETQSVSASL